MNEVGGVELTILCLRVLRNIGDVLRLSSMEVEMP
jgi:hypothetical protein